jgi:hypothetical protein
MKRNIIRSVLMGSLLSLLAGCASTGIRHVNAEEFIRQAESMEGMNSMGATFYVGTSPTRAYLECSGYYKLLGTHNAMVYWTELDSLPPEIKDELKQGEIPWTPWQNGN